MLQVKAPELRQRRVFDDFIIYSYSYIYNIFIIFVTYSSSLSATQEISPYFKIP